MMARVVPRRPIHFSRALSEPARSLEEPARPLEEPASRRRPRVQREVEACFAESRLVPVSVWEVLEEVLSTLGPSAAGVGIQVALLTPAAQGVPRVAADWTRFAQILMSLGSNAIKYNRPGGSITFSVSRVDADFVRVTVADTGAGMAPSPRDHWLSPDQHAGRGRPRRGGMALAISERLAKMMHGAIGFRSLWPKGAEFWLDLPVYV
jgi:signal transduction histidine kinase